MFFLWLTVCLIVAVNNGSFSYLKCSAYIVLSHLHCKLTQAVELGATLGLLSSRGPVSNGEVPAQLNQRSGFFLATVGNVNHRGACSLRADRKQRDVNDAATLCPGSTSRQRPPADGTQKLFCNISPNRWMDEGIDDITFYFVGSFSVFLKISSVYYLLKENQAVLLMFHQLSF